MCNSLTSILYCEPTRLNGFKCTANGFTFDGNCFYVSYCMVYGRWFIHLKMYRTQQYESNNNKLHWTVPYHNSSLKFKLQFCQMRLCYFLYVSGLRASYSTRQLHFLWRWRTHVGYFHVKANSPKQFQVITTWLSRCCCCFFRFENCTTAYQFLRARVWGTITTITNHA